MSTANNTSSSSNNRIANTVLVFLLLVFIGSSTFFAVKLQEGIVPDEYHHFNVSKLFSTTWGIPPDTLETIPYGVINHWPFLSYWINARIFNLLNWVVPSISDRTSLIFFRLINVFYSTLTLLFGYLFAKEIIKNQWGSIFVVFLLTTTLMFVFLSGGDTYDNLINLCSFAGIYFLTRVLNDKSFYINSVIWLICMLIGTLIKVTMLPLLLITGIIWLIYVVKQRRNINIDIKYNYKFIGAALIVITIIIINFSIYGVNIVRYRTLVPTCVQVFSESQCMAYEQYARDMSLQQNLSLSEVFSSGYQDPIEYGLNTWIPLMLQRIYGIMGHKAYFPDISISFHILLIIWTIFVAIRYWDKPSFALIGSLIVLLLYILVLFQNNYSSEMFYGFQHVGLQGRYIFPVIGIYYTIMVYYFLKIPNFYLKSVTFISTSILFLYGSPIVFLLRFFSSKYASWFY